MQADALDVAEELEVPDAGGWLLIGTAPMGLLVDAHGIFCNTRLNSIPELKAAICVRPRRWCLRKCELRAACATGKAPRGYVTRERARGLRSLHLLLSAGASASHRTRPSSTYRVFCFGALVY
jgi:hypothetical protein